MISSDLGARWGGLTPHPQSFKSKESFAAEPWSAPLFTSACLGVPSVIKPGHGRGLLKGSMGGGSAGKLPRAPGSWSRAPWPPGSGRGREGLGPAQGARKLDQPQLKPQHILRERKASQIFSRPRLFQENRLGTSYGT